MIKKFLFGLLIFVIGVIIFFIISLLLGYIVNFLGINITGINRDIYNSFECAIINGIQATLILICGIGLIYLIYTIGEDLL